MNPVFIDIYQQIWKEIFSDISAFNFDQFQKLYTQDLPLAKAHQCSISQERIFCGQEYAYQHFISEQADRERSEQGNNMQTKKDLSSLTDVLNNISNIAMFKGSRQKNSEVVEDSDDTYSSSYVYNCVHTYSSQKMLFCYNNRACEYLMASSGNGECSFGIKLKDSGSVSNSFDMHWCGKSANCYFCANSSDLMDCMFCFSFVSKQYCIANMQFEKEEYFKLKEIILHEYFQQLDQANAFISIENL